MAVSEFIFFTSILFSLLLGVLLSYLFNKRNKKSRPDLSRFLMINNESKRFQDIITKAPIGIFVSTLEGKYLYANAKLAEFLGYKDAAELIQKVQNVNDLYVDPHVRKKIIERLSSRDAGSYEKFTVQYYRKDKSKVWSNMYVRSYPDSETKSYILEGFEEDITEQVLTEEKLKLNEKLYRNLFESIGSSSIVLDAAGMILLANPGFEKLLEVEKQQVENQRFITSFIHPEDQPKLNAYLRLIKGPESMTGETEARFISATGRLCYCHVHVSYIQETGNQLVSLNDVTEFRNTQEKLFKSREQYKAILKAIPDILYLVDKNGNFLDSQYNSGSKYPLGISNPKAQNIGDLYPGTISRIMLSFIETCLNNNNMTIKELEIPDPLDALTLHIEARFVPAGPEEALVLIRDISERKRNEKDLRIFAHAIKSITECINITDINNNILFVNQAFLHTYGFASADEVIGKNISIIVSPNNDSFLIEDIQNGRLKENWQGELLNRKKDGQDFPVYLSTSLIRDEASNTLAIFAVAIDISQRIHQEKSIKDLNQRLILKNKELEQIIYITSHDLRSPLVNIDGFAYELNRQYEKLFSLIIQNNPDMNAILSILEKEIPGCFQYIHASTRKMESLINGLLKLSRLGREELQLRQLDMNALVLEVLKNFEFQIHNQKSVIKSFDLPQCFGDETLINQLFSNLISNSLKYTHPERNPEITISGRINHRFVEYIVADNGIGIPEDKKEKVFEIFFRLNQEKAGEGLGLTIVKKIVEKHEGNIHIESNPSGTRCYIRFPIRT